MRGYGTNAVRAGLLILLFYQGTASLAAQERPLDLAEEQVHATSAKYKAEAWPRGDRRGGFPLASLRIEGWSGGQLRSDSGHMSRKFSRAGIKSGAPSFVVEGFVTDTIEQSHAELLTWLAGIQSPMFVPRVQDRELRIGDVGFLGTSTGPPEIISWIAFVRGNVAIRLSNFDPRSHRDLDLPGIAKELDRVIASQPKVAAGAKLRRPEIIKLDCQKRELVAGEIVRIDFNVIDSAGGTPYLRWVVGGPGQGYVERENDGAWYLRTTGPGRISLSLEVTGSTGTFARRTILLSVADD